MQIILYMEVSSGNGIKFFNQKLHMFVNFSLMKHSWHGIDLMSKLFGSLNH